MNPDSIFLDTGKITYCDRCLKNIEPSQPKAVAGWLVNDYNLIVVYCPQCWELVQPLIDHEHSLVSHFLRLHKG